VSVTYPLLLDEMFSDGIAGQLRKRRCDVLAVVADPGLIALSDDQILAAATDGCSVVLRAPVDGTGWCCVKRRLAVRQFGSVAGPVGRDARG
jgi:hypothetical protein